MADQLGFRQIRLVLNGHPFQKWSDADPPVTFEKMDMLDFTYGRDGALYVNDKAMKGGTMDVSLLPTSPSAVRILRWFTQRQNDRRLQFSGMYSDTAIGYSLRLLGGFLQQCDPTIVPGKMYEAQFRFENWVPNVDGVAFSDTITVNA